MWFIEFEKRMSELTTKERLILAASAAYPGRLVELNWDFESNNPMDAMTTGDTLASFVGREIDDTVPDTEEEGFEHAWTAARAMQKAVDELTAVRDALMQRSKWMVLRQFFGWLKHSGKLFSRGLFHSWLQINLPDAMESLLGVMDREMNEFVRTPGNETVLAHGVSANHDWADTLEEFKPGGFSIIIAALDAKLKVERAKVTEDGVNAWPDASGNDKALTQGDPAKRPTYIPKSELPTPPATG
jgi:hypothetical protein